ncbi:MAG TPA: hypothetical protein PLW99_02245 [Candidatus Paceibacterota bacterium]|nr:hypothetical protein [Candidatus Paceibacterota bacterium]
MSADGRVGSAHYHDQQSGSGLFQSILGGALTIAGVAMGFGPSLFGTSALFGSSLSTTISTVSTLSSAQATLGLTGASAIATLSGPASPAGTVETSNNLGVGTWTWSALPVINTTSTANTTSTCTAPNVLVNGVCTTPSTTTCTPPQTLVNGVCTTPTIPTCTAPLTQTVTVACDPNASGQTAVSGSVTRSQTKSAYPGCTFPTPVTASNSTYVSDTCVYPPPPLSVSCVGTPGDPFVGQNVKWASTVSGGSGNSYIYEWSGSENLAGTVDATSPVYKPYTTTGLKTASLTVVDNTSGQTSPPATCTAGANQIGGGSGGGNGVLVRSCTSSLTTGADGSFVDAGGSTSVSWQVSGGTFCASSCTGHGFTIPTSGTNSISGTLNNVPVPSNGTFGLSCTGGTYGPPASATRPVTVVFPKAHIAANNQTGMVRVNAGTPQNTTITWSSDGDAVSCTGTNFSTNLYGQPDATSGSVTLTTTSQTTYTVTCTNGNGVSATDSVLVNIVPVFNQF